MLIYSTLRTKISSLNESHFNNLYEWISDEENIMLWSNIREIPSAENYFAFLKFQMEYNFVSQFVISRASSKELLGTIFVHDYNLDDQYASISAYLKPTARKKFYGMESYFLTFNHIFNKTQIRKLYLDVFDYNDHSLALIQKIGFNLEGRFISHRNTGNGYADLIRYSFFKKDWAKMKDKNKRLLNEIVSNDK